MKKYVVSFLFVLLITPFFSVQLISNIKFFDSYGINLGFNTFKLLGNLSSVQSQLSPTNFHSGGGLSFIESGVDISSTLFIDSNLRHRIIVGGEYIWMNAREVFSHSSLMYTYAQNRVQFANFYLGYHCAFYNAPYQNVKIYGGAEAMLNNITLSELSRGTVRLQNPSENTETLYLKDATTRIGGRVRAGFEGQLYEQLYINASFTLGFFNLLMRDNSTGELFNSKNSFETKESLQPFFNYLISFQYRLNK